MDGFLFLLILYWIFKAVIKKKKGEKGKPLTKGMKPDPEARKRAEREARIHNEKMRRQLSMFDKPAAAEHQAEMVSQEGVSHAVDYRGSLNAETTEGECICDPSLEHGRADLPDPESVYATEITDAPRLDLSPSGIWQGVVMSEILKRPAERFRR